LKTSTNENNSLNLYERSHYSDIFRSIEEKKHTEKKTIEQISNHSCQFRRNPIDVIQSIS